MEHRFATAFVALVFAASAANAEWKVLRDDTGRIVEVALDFTVETLRIDSSGTTRFVAMAKVDGEEVGFSASLSKPRESTIDVQNAEKELPIMRTDLDIRSVGAATNRLEHRLNEQLGSPGDEKSAARLRVVGLFSGISPQLAASVAEMALVYCVDVGITYDDRGNRVPGECFGMKLVIDGPLGRGTIYFHRKAGYGGTSAADRQRDHWYDSHQEEQANKPADRMPGSHAPGESGRP